MVLRHEPQISLSPGVPGWLGQWSVRLLGREFKPLDGHGAYLKKNLIVSSLQLTCYIALGKSLSSLGNSRQTISNVQSQRTGMTVGGSTSQHCPPVIPTIRSPSDFGPC